MRETVLQEQGLSNKGSGELKVIKVHVVKPETRLLVAKYT